jgi:hypothetical protein
MIPTSWKLAAVLVALGALGGLGLAIEHNAYKRGSAAATAQCEADKARQVEANRTAIGDAAKDLFKGADAVSLKSLELTNALEAIDAAAAADPAGAQCGLSADSVRDLGTIR